jgi:iron complex outermembrane receptor protein
VVVTASPPASASAPTDYSASTSLGATKTDQPLITTAQSVVVTRQQMADQGEYLSQALEYTPRVYSSFDGGATGSTLSPPRLPRRRRR